MRTVYDVVAHAEGMPDFLQSLEHVLVCPEESCRFGHGEFVFWCDSNDFIQAVFETNLDDPFRQVLGVSLRYHPEEEGFKVVFAQTNERAVDEPFRRLPLDVTKW